MSDTDLWAYESLLSIQDVTDAKPRIPYNEWYCLYALPVHGRPIAQVKHYFLSSAVYCYAPVSLDWPKA